MYVPVGVEKLYILILAVVFGIIVLHAPLSVALSTLWPDYSLLIKSWKEILIALAGVLAMGLLYRKKRLAILKEPLLIGIGIYIVLHLIAVFAFAGGLASSAAGLMIDLRYIIFFALVYIALRLYPYYQKLFLNVGVIGALLVVVFALLQVFVLPIDVLKYIGYNINSIMPYLTVDQNPDFIRINSTLRGPNPLGAYAVIVLTSVVAWFAMKTDKLKVKPAFLVAILLLGGVVALWSSYSRSALLAAMLAIAIVVLSLTFRKYRKLVVIVGAAMVMLLSVGLIMGRNSDFISNVVLHEDPNESNQVNSNEGHVSSLQDGLSLLIRQPFGAGVGSTGSASLYGDAPLIIENQYLLIAHEVGWLGLIFFLLIFIGVLTRLWQRRSDWLALGVFASGIGLAFIGLLLPVWVDDTVAIIWWGLAALAIARRQDD